MNRLLSKIRTGDNPFFWILFLAGTVLALIYVFDQLTDENLMGAMWLTVKNF